MSRFDSGFRRSLGAELGFGSPSSNTGSSSLDKLEGPQLKPESMKVEVVGDGNGQMDKPATSGAPNVTGLGLLKQDVVEEEL